MTDFPTYEYTPELEAERFSHYFDHGGHALYAAPDNQCRQNIDLEVEQTLLRKKLFGE